MEWWRVVDHEEALRRGEPPVPEHPIYSREIDDILRAGLWLFPCHCWGLERAAALTAIGRLEVAGIALLGAEVRLHRGGRWEATGDSVSVDALTNESHAQFVARSARKVADYIRAYPTGGEDQLFELTPTTDTVDQVRALRL